MREAIDNIKQGTRTTNENDNGSPVIADLLSFARGSQSAVEEFGGGAELGK